MNIAPRIAIQGLRTQLCAVFMLTAVVFLFFFAAMVDPLLAAGLGGIAFALTGWFYTQRITRPLQNVAEAARQIAHGERCARLPVPERGEEIALLASAINELLAYRERQNHELFTRETQFLSTFENAAVGIAHVGLDCRWHRVNARLCEITGYPRDELLTKTFIDITHPDDLGADMANVRAMLAGEIPSYSIEKRYIRKDGSPIWCNLTVTLARDATGQPAYLISVVEDISVRKQAEEALREREAQFRGTFENAAVGIAHVGLDCHWLRVNSKLCEITGYSREELLAKTFVEISHPGELDADLAYMREMLAGEIPSYSMEKRYIRKDGALIWINLTVALARDAAAQPAYFIAVIEEISARKQTEERLRKKQELLRMATDVGRVHAFEWDPISDEVVHTRGFEEALGLKEHPLHYTGQEYFASVHPEDLARFQGIVLGLTPSADTYATTYRIIRPDGRVVVFEEHGRGFFDEEGRMVRVIGMTADITARATAEQALRESEENHRRILDNLFIFVGVLSPDGTVISANRVSLEMAGITIEETRGRKFWDTYWWAYSPAAQDRLRESIARCVRGEALRYDTEVRIAHGRRIAVDFMLGPVRDREGRITHLVPSAVDITDRKRAEEGLREREERLRMATAVGRIVTFEWDPVTDVVIRSENFRKILGLDDDGSQSTGQKFFTIIHPEDRDRLKGLLWGLNPAANTYATTYRLIRPDGGVLTFEERARGLFDEDGRMVRVIGMATEITDRKRAEDALRESEDRLSTVVEHLTEGLIIADSQGKLIRWNPAALTMLGYASEEECRRNIPEFADTFEFKSPESGQLLPMEEWPMPRVLRGEVLCDCEVRVHRIDQGWERLFSYSGSQVRSASGELLSVLVFTDITARKRAEEELSAAKEAAEAANHAKDDFLASLSHELRTPLNPVLMLASEMEQHDALSPDLREDFALIRKNVALEARLIDDLLDLTRITRGKLQLEMRQVNAHEVLNQALAVVHADIVQKRIALSVKPNASERSVKADPVRLQQIFWNVLCNAVKFTPPGGRITVRTHNTPDRRICVEIADTGIGMTPEEIGRMFTAFSQGEHALQPGSQYRFGGLGLGLTICRRLVTMHGGHIHAQSAGRGLGSTFTIELPLTAAEVVAPEVPAGESPRAEPSAPKHFHILLVEDHEPTRTTLSRLLRRRGHDVLCAESLAAGRKLVADLATSQGDAGFDLLISDLGLPDGNGCELMTEVRKRYNGSVRGVALSGFGMEDDIRRSLASGFSTHLTKPVDIQSLENAMQMEK